MTEHELHAFVIDCLIEVFRQQGQTIVDINTTMGADYPNFILESPNGKLYYVLVDSFIFPSSGGRFRETHLSEFIKISETAKALPAVAAVGVYCFETNGSSAICGGTFALKYESLQALHK